MRNGLRAAALAVAVIGLTGCSSDGRVGVEGTVTYDGQPVQWGTITFLPLEGQGLSAGGPITDGRFAVAPRFGPKRGKYRVQVNWAKPTGKKYKNELGDEIDRTVEGLPEKYHKNSTLTADFHSGKNRLNLTLEK